MNERIKELLTPKLKEWGGASGDNFSEELEKFAELIVWECAAQFPGTFTDEQYQRRIDKTILKHFGVIE